MPPQTRCFPKPQGLLFLLSINAWYPPPHPSLFQMCFLLRFLFSQKSLQLLSAVVPLRKHRQARHALSVPAWAGHRPGCMFALHSREAGATGQSSQVRLVSWHIISCRVLPMTTGTRPAWEASESNDCLLLTGAPQSSDGKKPTAPHRHRGSQNIRRKG